MSINKDLLPDRCMLDTGVLIRALGQRPDDPAAPLCRDLFRTLLANRKTILVAAPTMAELLRGEDPIEPPRTPNVIVVPFDLQAARLLGHRAPASLIRKISDTSGLTRTYLKFDALIAACAARHQAECLVAIDRDFYKMAPTLGVTTRTPADFEETQRTIMDVLDESPEHD